MRTPVPQTSIYYCHGLPGSWAEIVAINSSGLTGIGLLDPMDLAEFDRWIGDSKAHIIGFSLGAMTALHIAAKRPDKVAKISLIAPAAPLELGDFLPAMAGQGVFEMAKKGPAIFRMFTAAQGLGVRLSPDAVIKAMFKGSPEADMVLLRDPRFSSALKRGLTHSLLGDNSAYRAAVLRYVNPWAHELSSVKCPVTIHHGTADNWAPFSMSEALQETLAAETTLTPYEGLGHYSTLHAAMPIVANINAV